MVFMQDSERAARLAIDYALDAGLHLNFTTSFSASSTPRQLAKHQESVSRFLLSSRLAPAVFHPGLTGAFEYLVSAQLSEFARLYGKEVARIDGHHHMHLSANVLFKGLLPAGVALRRNSSFFSGDKSFLNRFYRRTQDLVLARRHPMPDYLFEFSSSVRNGYLPRICNLAREFCVEIETHPVRAAEYELLAGGRIFSMIDDLTIAPWFRISRRTTPR
jgi:hypothetical protein